MVLDSFPQRPRSDRTVASLSDGVAVVTAFSPHRLRADLLALLQFGPRSPNDAGLAAAIGFLEAELGAMGYTVIRESFGHGAGDCNITAERAASDPQAPLIEVGAHYDTVPGSPGADDNGSGVIGVLAIARHFASLDVRRSVRFCLFGQEEIGLLGSEAHQQVLNGENRPFEGGIVFEMIGCRRHEPNSQRTPARIPFVLWPPRTGDFLALVADHRSRALARGFENAAAGHVPRLPLYPIKAIGGLLKDVMRSDHSSYWRAGRPAIMLTDTANFRNPHYHAPSDTVETIDFDFVATVAATTAATIQAWACGPGNTS